MHLHIQIYDLFSDHVAESKGTGWLPSFRASATLHLPKAGPVPDPDQPFPWIHVDKIPKLVHILEPVLYYLKYIDLRFLILILGLYLNSSTHKALITSQYYQTPHFLSLILQDPLTTLLDPIRYAPVFG